MTNGDEPGRQVRQEVFFDEFTKDLHFFPGTTQQFHFVAPNLVIIGVLPIPEAGSGCSEAGSTSLQV